MTLSKRETILLEDGEKERRTRPPKTARTTAERHSMLSTTDPEHGEEILRINYEKIARKAGSQSPTQKRAIRDHDTPRMDELAATATPCGVFRKPRRDAVLQAPPQFNDWTHLVGARI